MEKRKRMLLFIGILLVALNFRPAITSIPPVLEAIRTDLHLSYTAVSLLTTIPTILMGFFAFSAAAVSRRFGRERAILWAVVLIALSTALRIWGANWLVLFGTTVLVGIGIAISQALLPAVINDHFPGRAALMTGLYTACLGIGAAIAAGGTAILAGTFGSWPAALAFWAVLGIVAAAVLVPSVRIEGAQTSGSSSAPKRMPWTSPGAWILTAFFSVDSFIYYALLTWLAPLYVNLGWAAERAGFLLTLFIIAQILGSLGISVLADRFTDRRPWLVLTIAMVLIGLSGFVRYPFVSPWGWAFVTGIGMGGLFALNLTLPVDLSRDASVADRLTPMMLGVGYIVGATGPFVIGWVRELFGSYDPAFVGLIGLGVVLLVLTPWFRPDRSVS